MEGNPLPGLVNTGTSLVCCGRRCDDSNRFFRRFLLRFMAFFNSIFQLRMRDITRKKVKILINYRFLNRIIVESSEFVKVQL